MTARYYLAGPMTGIPQFNFPLFHAAAAALRAAGYAIVSPAEMDSPAVQSAAAASTDGAMTDGKVGGETWGEMLARDVRIIADDVQGIIFLPSWQRSRGARLEAFTGLLCKHRFGLYSSTDPLVTWIPDTAVQSAIQEAW